MTLSTLSFSAQNLANMRQETVQQMFTLNGEHLYLREFVICSSIINKFSRCWVSCYITSLGFTLWCLAFFSWFILVFQSPIAYDAFVVHVVFQFSCCSCVLCISSNNDFCASVLSCMSYVTDNDVLCVSLSADILKLRQRIKLGAMV